MAGAEIGDAQSCSEPSMAQRRGGSARHSDAHVRSESPRPRNRGRESDPTPKSQTRKRPHPEILKRNRSTAPNRGFPGRDRALAV
eukprot:3489492-Rhodomonas_salina.3